MPRKMAATKPSTEGVPRQCKSKASIPLAVLSDELPSCGTTGMHFVVSTGIEKPDPELRKLIRSHVMLGKNRGKILTPRKKKLKGAPQPASSSSDPSLPSASDPDQDAENRCSASSIAFHALPVTIPRVLGSGMSTICFADVLEPGTIEVVLQLSSIAKQLLFPLEPCMFFDRRAENWIAPLAVDPAYLHAMIFTSQFYFDALRTGKSVSISRRAMPHFLKTLKLLRERMADDNQAKLSDSTAAAIMGLVGHAQLTGDFKTARHHMEGLYKIVILRGGVTTFRTNAKLLVEILRCDIGLSLHTGSKPIFFSNQTRDPFVPYPDLTSLVELTNSSTTNHHRHSFMFLDGIDEELAQTCRVMSDFCNVINFAVNSELRISTETFLDTMTSVVYRLLNMHFETGFKEEAIRLGLLAFLCGVFLQWKHLGLSYANFTSMLRICLIGMASECISSELMVWLLMVGAVSGLDESDDAWLKPLLRVNVALCEIGEWRKMQALLKAFMWIPLVYDKPGKSMFDSIVAGPSSA